MGTISNPATSYSLMDMWFDLDEALTLPEEHIGGACGGGNINSNATGTVNTLVANMPTVAAVELEAAICSVCAQGFYHDQCSDDDEEEEEEEKMNGIAIGVGKQVPCGHVYHETCIAKWLFNSNSCPLCRSPILSN
ncbi:PREDICTED: E3 ubiquitin-ligase [Prunus dulcis]|uniref:RING-type E3 ubiquitin transferase n=2 Tax=Prunus dulcis TaxID=3755 RepID=A0A5E4E4Z2_PRUDU|nr:PREDICTED: E3 ubiquitin-ligase [Prunus dulcis]